MASHGPESGYDPDKQRRHRRLRFRLVAFGFLAVSPIVYYGVGFEAAIAAALCALILFVVGFVVG